MHKRVAKQRTTHDEAPALASRPASSIAGLPAVIGNRAMARVAAGLREPQGSRALALRRSMRATGPRAIARDLTKHHYVWKGKFQMNMKTQKNPGAYSGLSGTITFTPDKTGGDTTKLRLFQAVRLEDLTTGKDFQWTGVDKPRSDMQTTADAKKGIDPGWWIDMNPALAAKRTKKADATVTPYYRDYWPNAANSQDGTKKGATVTDASLWDFPSWNKKSRYSFETVAKAADTGEVYGAVQWGFTISDAAKGTVDNEYSRGRGGPSATTNQALHNLDEFYGNPGASTAPKK
jgi:hypothetical protein